METNAQIQILEILQTMQVTMQTMQTEMTTLHTGMQTMQTEMTTLHTEMKNMQSEMEIMQSQIKNMQLDIKNMQKNIKNIQNEMENRFRKVELQIREVIDCLTVVENSTMLMEKEYADKISILFDTREDANKNIEEHRKDIIYLKQENEKNKIKMMELLEIGGLRK